MGTLNDNEFVAAKLSEVPAGTMKAVEHGELRILLSNIDGEIFAVGGSCPHYGAQLEKGVLSDKRVVCPLHHAAFDVRTGELLEPPALDCLPTFEVRIDGDEIIVAIPPDTAQTRQPDMLGYDPEGDPRTFVVLGAGAAAAAAVQTLREDGYRGRLVMITQESRLPYDRPNLSKDYLQGNADPEWMPLRSDEFYEGIGIEIMRDAKVKTVEVPSMTITFENGEALLYDKLLIATGGVPRVLKVPGADLKNVFTLRSYDDADAIIAALDGAKRAVVIGGSFIGMETAASLRSRGLEVTVVAPEQTPFERVFGREIGERFRRAHEEQGVTFRLGASVEQIEGKSAVSAVQLGSGEKLPADLVVIGIGVRPATDFLMGLDLAEDGGVVVDEYFQAIDDVYAAGDVAQFPDWRTGERQRIEHWRTAEQQGRQAAHNMAGKDIPYTGIPFFWTRQAGLALSYVGHATSWDDLIVHGSIADGAFLAFYIKGGQVAAVAGMKRHRDLDTAHELLRRGKMPDIAELRRDDLDLSIYL